MKNFKKSITLVLLIIVQFSFGAEGEKLKINHGPYLQNVSQTGANILFSTEGLVVPGIILFEEGKAERIIKNSNDGLYHVGKGVHNIKISGLKPGTNYGYKAFGIEVLDFGPYKCVFGDTVFTSQCTFTTLDLNKKEVAFTVFCDVHDEPAKIGKCMEKIKVGEQDFIFLNGDIMGYVHEEVQIYESFIDTCVSRFAQNVPFVFVRGNHETRGACAQHLKKYLGLANDSYYHAFSHGPARFIILDGGEDKPDNDIEYSGLVDFDTYREQQLNWLKQEVNSEEFRRAAAKIVIIHMPIIKDKNNWYGMDQLAQHYGPVLDNAGIDLMICGHMHKNMWIAPGKTGFNYPVMVCSNNDFMEVKLDSKKLNLKIKDKEGQLVYTQSIVFD